MTHLDLAIREGFFTPHEWSLLSSDVQDKILLTLYRNQDRSVDVQFRFEIRLLAAALSIPSHQHRDKELHLYNVMRFWGQLTDMMDEKSNDRGAVYYEKMCNVMKMFIVIYNNLDPKYENDKWNVEICEDKWKSIEDVPPLVFSRIDVNGNGPLKSVPIKISSERRMLYEFEKHQYNIPIVATLTGKL